MIGKIIALCLVVVLLVVVGILWDNYTKVQHNPISKAIVIGFSKFDDSGLFTTSTYKYCVVNVYNDSLNWIGSNIRNQTKIQVSFSTDSSCPYNIGDKILIQPESPNFAKITGDWSK